MELGAARAAEVAERRVVDAELVVEVVDELRDQEVEIRPALPVSVRGHVERHALDARLEVGAVIEVEAAHEVLVRLALARVLRDDDAGHRLQQLALARDRPRAEIRRADAPFRRAARGADQVVEAADDLHGVDEARARAVPRTRRWPRGALLRVERAHAARERGRETHGPDGVRQRERRTGGAWHRASGAGGGRGSGRGSGRSAGWNAGPPPS